MSSGGRKPRGDYTPRKKHQITTGTTSTSADAENSGTGAATSNQVATTSSNAESNVLNLMGIVKWDPKQKKELADQLRSQGF
jgi:hypothetical protein